MKALLLSLWLGALILLSGCQQKAQTYQEQSYVFGTLVEVSVYGENEDTARMAVAAVMQEFQRLHELLHAWKPSSLSALNAALAQGQKYAVTSETAAMLKQVAALSEQSHRLFNPAIGGLVRAWGFQADEFNAALPDDQEIAAWVAADPRMSALEFTPDASNESVWVFSNNPAVQIDLGGYAKGYALDRAAALLKQMGVHNALINIGGNVLALGAHGERPWRVGIQHPRLAGPIATLALHDGEAVGTSGDYQRYFELNGVRYCHLLDPRSGRPARDAQAVTVLAQGADAGVRSDAPSKPLFISGQADWRETARQSGVDYAMLIDQQGVVHVTPELRKRLEFRDKTVVVREVP